MCFLLSFHLFRFSNWKLFIDRLSSKRDSILFVEILISYGNVRVNNGTKRIFSDCEKRVQRQSNHKFIFHTQQDSRAAQTKVGKGRKEW